jgi:hypothetical protein
LSNFFLDILHTENYKAMKRRLLTAVLMVLFTGAFAQPGVLDQTFGVGGKIILNSSSSHSFTVLMQPDKKLIISVVDDDPGGGYKSGSLRRYNKDGSIDPTFQINYGTIHNNDGYLIYKMTIQPDQKIVAICHHYSHNFGSGSDDFDNTYLYRFNANGTFDKIFSIQLICYLGCYKRFNKTKRENPLGLFWKESFFSNKRF